MGRIKTPYMDLVPPLRTEEFEALKADIKANGQLHDAFVDEEGNLLDGHHRYKVLKAKLRTRVVKGLSPAQKEAFVFRSSNTHRNLSPDQKEAMRKRMQTTAKQLREEDPKEWTQARVAAELGVTQKTVSTWFSNNIPGNKATKPDARVQVTPAGREKAIALAASGKSQAKIASDIGVSQKTVSNILKQEKRKQEKVKELAQRESNALAKTGDWEIRLGESVDELGNLESESVRLVFADPPYNIGIDYGKGAKSDSLDDQDFLSWCNDWFEEVWRILAPDGSFWLMINDEYAAEFCLRCKSLGFAMRNWIKWYETFGNNCANKFNRTSRHIFYFVKNPKEFVFNQDAVTRPSDRQAVYRDRRANHHGKLWDDVWWIPRLTGTSKERLPEFPTQLPEELLLAIVGCASDAGDLVVDPFNGSGTTGAACIQLNRRYIGIDREEKWITKAKARLVAVSTTSA